MTKSVIFDIGRVLLDWDVYLLYRKLLPNDEAIAEFMDEVDLLRHNLEFDRGTPIDKGIAALVEEFPHRRELLEAFDKRWDETVPGAIEGSVEILSELKHEEVPLYAITNFARETWQRTTNRFEFLTSSFIDIVVSGHEGMIKPDAQIYKLLLHRNQLRAENCVFIDDSEKNVIGARAVGIDAIQFFSPAQLRQELLARDLPIQPIGNLV